MKRKCCNYAIDSKEILIFLIAHPIILCIVAASADILFLFHTFLFSLRLAVYICCQYTAGFADIISPKISSSKLPTNSFIYVFYTILNFCSCKLCSQRKHDKLKQKYFNGFCLTNVEKANKKMSFLLLSHVLIVFILESYKQRIILVLHCLTWLCLCLKAVFCVVFIVFVHIHSINKRYGRVFASAHIYTNTQSTLPIDVRIVHIYSYRRFRIMSGGQISRKFRHNKHWNTCYSAYSLSRCERAVDLSLSSSFFLSVRISHVCVDSAHLYTYHIVYTPCVPYTHFWYPFYLFVVQLFSSWKFCFSWQCVSYAFIGFAPKAAHIGLDLGFMVSVVSSIECFFFHFWFHMVESIDVCVVADWIWRYMYCGSFFPSCYAYFSLNLRCVLFVHICDTILKAYNAFLVDAMEF